jgi:multidrug efflux pump subunit AcrB
MSDRIIAISERLMTTAVNGIEHLESQSLQGVGVIKVFFHPDSNVDLAVSQITAISQTILKFMPPGATPPQVIAYDASSVPVIQLGLSSEQLSEQELYDLGNSFIRTQLATVQGAALPYPYGGKLRQVQIDLDQAAMQAKGVSPQDVVDAVSAQNVILPAGTEKIGLYEYNVTSNASPQTIAELNELPIKTADGNTLYVRDVAHVRDGYAPQTSVVRVDGHRAVLMPIQKTGATSTLDIIEQIKGRLPLVRDASPPGLKIDPVGDQSVFVGAAVEGVVREGLIAAALTAIMILLFLGSWRSTLIIALSIPLSVLASLIVLAALGQTINIMTLGGLALAVGVLVDDATVAIENINWHLERGKPVERAILDGAQQIAVPALVSTLCICVSFVPMFFLSGAARFLFVPLAEAVVFAMLASYVLSRTLVPTLAKFWLKPHAGHASVAGRGLLSRYQAVFERGFGAFRRGYRRLLGMALVRRRSFAAGFMAVVIASLALTPELGQDFFPAVDGGQIKLHVRAHSGTRIEETARLCDQIEARIRDVIPAVELQTMVDNIGLPVSGLNLTYSNSAPTGTADADVLISLNESHRPVADYVRTLRDILPDEFPGVGFAFLPADIVGQILNFGVPAPIDIQIAGFNGAANRQYAYKLFEKLKKIPGIADLHIHQAIDAPQLRVAVDRSRAEELGLTQRDVINNMLISLSGSFQTQPTFWLNPKNGVSYSVVAQTPQYQLDSLQALDNLPVTGSTSQPPQILGAVAEITRGVAPIVASHYNVQSVIDIFAAVQDRDLGGVSADIQRILAETADLVPKGATVVSRGQVKTMESSFTGLYGGLAVAIVLIYLLIVVNFQSWLDAFIIIAALPAALAGIVWMLFLTHTTLSVPALTGAIMCMGVATANSILIVSFAREKLQSGRDAFRAALEAGFGRLRPVLMTALAMIIGMVPMALGLGEGGEQNAPLGRAVIGGLAMATAATLFFVPTIFCLLHGRERRRPI